VTEQQVDLQQMMRQSQQLHAWFLALQEAGFSELMAFGLLQHLVMTGAAWRIDYRD
jgi:hypothetical protein